MIRAVIFDLDGVLVDAVQWHSLALNQALKLFAYSIDENEHAKVFNGLPTTVKLELLSQLKGFPRGLHGFTNEMKQQFTREILASRCKPDAQKIDLLERLEASEFLIGLASNSKRATIDIVLNRMGITDFFDSIVSQEEVKRAKPAPDVYLKCQQALGVKPEECLIIEDSAPGVQAARAACPNVLVVENPAQVTWERIQEFLKNPRNANPRKEIEIVIPMAGQGKRFADAGFKVPKPFIEIDNTPMIQWVVDNLRPNNIAARFTFLCNDSHLESPHWRRRLQQIAPGCSTVRVPGVTEGAACTLLLAIDRIDLSKPLVIANSDQWIGHPIDDFLDSALKSDCDGMIMTFPANAQKWSYAQVDGKNRVTRVAEKQVISPHATVGIYYFKTGRDFVSATQRMIAKGIRTNNEFYTCPVYNELIEMGKNIQIFEIPEASMHGLGTPEDLDKFIHSREITYANGNSAEDATGF